MARQIILFQGTTNYHFLWKTDGTAVGTAEIAGVAHQLTVDVGLLPEDMTELNGEVLFSGYDDSANVGLWVTNGSAAGTYELTGINGANSQGLNPSSLTVFEGKILFAGSDAQNNRGLWITDGSAAGTQELTNNFGRYGGPSDLTVFGNEVLFDGVDAQNRGLWVTNGTAAGTYEIQGISGAGDNLNPQYLTLLNGEVLFAGFSAGGPAGLWITNGTAAGTSELTPGISGVSAFGFFPPT